MLTKFVQTANVKCFLGAVTKAQERGAREAGWIFVYGDRGTGKTRTLKWWALKQSYPYLRAKTEWTPRWMLEDLALELGLSAEERRKKDLFTKVEAAIRTKQVIVVVDEIELPKIRGNIKILETLRDLSDLTEMEVVVGGDATGIKHVLRHDQFSSRQAVPAVAFGTAAERDVALMCQELSEVALASDLVPEILRQSGGYYREIKNAIATLERIGKLNGGQPVTLQQVAGETLCAARHGALGRRAA